MNRIRLLLAFAILPTPSLAQTVAVTNARIVTLGRAGAIASGTVLVNDGKIVAVGTSVAIPAHARVIDAHGMFLTPGLVLTGSTIGLNDTVGPNPGGRSATGEVTAAFNAAGDFDPRHPQIGEARIEGVTRAVLTPNGQGSGKLFGGEGAVVDLGPSLEAVTRRHAAIVIDMGEAGAAPVGGRDALFEQLGAALDEARRFRRQPSGEGGSKLTPPDLTALRRVSSGKEPLLVQVDRAPDILKVLSFAHTQGIKVILSGATEGWMVADRIAAAGVPVLIDAEDNQPSTFDKLNATYENAGLLRKAGVTIAFKPGIARTLLLVRTPRFNAGRAVRYGLSWHDALAAITINPARIFGAADRFGSIEPGKEADLVLWSGDPFETTTVARMVMIRGVEQPLTARNRLLRDRYLSLPTGQ